MRSFPYTCSCCRENRMSPASIPPTNCNKRSGESRAGQRPGQRSGGSRTLCTYLRHASVPIYLDIHLQLGCARDGGENCTHEGG